MTIGEQAYLVLVLAGFFTFSITLATVAHQTNRWSRDHAAADKAHQSQSFDKAA
ncbi:MAG TPA: hypothetical protein VNF99_16860 [Stellaceae bacterium]|nr:hypothetical protein [Stellaceae bacterium]